MSLKRRRESSFLLADVEPDIHIRIHAQDEPLKAHYDLLKLFSVVARDLPRDASSNCTVWDLSGLVLGGESQPVSAELVQMWLGWLYVRVDASRREPALTDLLDDARCLLLFAGTCDTVIQDIGRSLASKPGLALKVVMGTGAERKELQLLLEGSLYCLHENGLGERRAPTSLRTAYDGLDNSAVQPAVAAALEEWLALAGQLHLVLLVRKLMAFAKTQMTYWHGLSILGPSVVQVLSPRVLKLLPPEVVYEAVAWRFLQPEPLDTVLGLSEPCKMLRPPGMFYDSVEGEASVHRTGDTERNTIKFSTGNILYLNLSLGGPGRQQLGELVAEVVHRAVEDEAAGPSVAQGSS
ncbi:hypothetical protein HYH02_011326 [Chlamydomonas schloesseri]|uniref:Uncharacterized protein n=1 Tax=Chlamydomonas schloesseri TaxID=2026947 RepID=A0A835W646_9CHLO|nr:hypothetical protein HYH02_011326 [Chlamydomonas schloesseri]|eukprot:KAG2437066.1 hypothetical protein HYH02_011326 [Chlamydomonas schloesseri]